MSWFRQMFGLSRDGADGRKDIDPWRTSHAAFSDRDNFVTNRVSVAEYMDAGAGSSDLALAATWSCVNLIAGTLGSLSLEVQRRIGSLRVPATDHPLYWVLHDSPAADLTALDFWEYQAAAVELRGNAYARVDRRANGEVVALEPIDPSTMRVSRGGGGALEYSWSASGNAGWASEREMLHIRGPMATALGGVSALTACRQVFSGARNADRAAGRLFANGVLSSGVLSTDFALKPDQRGELEELLADKFVGAANAGRPMLLDNGLKWQALSLSPEDAQMLETRRFGGEEICRLFGVPPAMVGYGDKASNWGTGKEVDVLGFQKFTLRRRAKRIEQAVSKQLLSAADRQAGYRVAFNFEDLLRGDSQGRAAFYNIMIRLGVMTRNEARALEGLPPVDGGDVVMVQMQDTPLANALEGKPE